ncbi:MAG TPA: helix-hairpin-helix domain-containing protein [Solirubrobacteraceae bacterium]
MERAEPGKEVDVGGKDVDVRADWVWLSLIPLGLGSWAPVYAGVRARKRQWLALGALWSLITVAGWVAAIASNGGAAGGLLIILGWAGAVATSFAIRDRYREALGSPFETAVLSAEDRLAERERARRLARERPALALEMGIGRPDLPNAQAAGLVDLNNAPATAIARLPGVDDALAAQIVQARSDTHGFSSVEDLGAALDLDGHLVEDLRDCVVFLPRAQ